MPLTWHIGRERLDEASLQFLSLRSLNQPSRQEMSQSGKNIRALSQYHDITYLQVHYYYYTLPTNVATSVHHIYDIYNKICTSTWRFPVVTFSIRWVCEKMWFSFVVNRGQHDGRRFWYMVPLNWFLSFFPESSQKSEWLSARVCVNMVCDCDLFSSMRNGWRKWRKGGVCVYS